MVLETTQTVPLEKWEDGSIRVKGTRLLVDLIIKAHKRGEIPEDIADSFPSAGAAEVYAIIAYYLTHKTEIENYLAQREAEAEAVRHEIESQPGYQARRNALREKIMARWAARNGTNADR